MVNQLQFDVGTAVVQLPAKQLAGKTRSSANSRKSIAQPYLGCENSLRYNGMAKPQKNEHYLLSGKMKVFNYKERK